MSKRFRVRFTHVDPYTLDFIKEDFYITIRSKEAAVKWVKQNYYRIWTINVEEE